MSKEEVTDTPSGHQPKRLLRSPKTWLIGGAALVVLFGIGLGSFFLFSPSQPTTTAGRTFTAEVTKATQTASVAVDGTLSPRKQANLNFAVSGEVTKVSAKAGQKVTKGQKLASIDSSSLQDAVDLAEANLTSARANYSDVSDSGTSAAIKAAAAQVDSAKASLSGAKENLKDASLRAPIAGTVASVDIAVGDQVSGSGSSSSSRSSSQSDSSTSSNNSSATTAQITVISTTTWKLEGTVGASDLSSLKVGQPATITANSTELKGTLTSVGIVATATSDGAATFPVVINLSGAQKGLYSGTTASAVVTTGTYPDVLTVATAAVTTKDGKTVVTKLAADGSTSTVEVAIGRVFGNATEITSGLADGDQVQITFRPSGNSSAGGSQGSGGFGGFGGMSGGGAPPGVAIPAGGGPNR